MILGFEKWQLKDILTWQEQISSNTYPVPTSITQAGTRVAIVRLMYPQFFDQGP